MLAYGTVGERIGGERYGIVGAIVGGALGTGLGVVSGYLNYSIYEFGKHAIEENEQWYKRYRMQ